MIAAVAAPRRSPLEHPARLITAAFALAIGVGTLLLLVPGASAGSTRTSLVDALFTATSAVTVTGLGTVDTARHWSGFGEAVILALIQIGGIGIMTLATLILVGISRRVGLRSRLLAQQEVGVLTLGEVRRVIRDVLLLSAIVEVATAAGLSGWFALRYDLPLPRALWHGVFHGVSAFNNAGFALYQDSLVRFVSDPVVNVVVMAAIVIGGLGVPVVAELSRAPMRWRRWSLHTKLVITTSVALVLGGWVLVGAFEWSNPDTLGSLSTPGRALAALFQSISPRTAGFNTLDYGAMRESTWLVTTVLMFIGAGPASTGGGIKVTTFAVLGFVILSEARGDRDVDLFGRRIPTGAQRQALAVALIGVGVVVATTLALIAISRQTIGAVLFEVASAFGTVGLTTGITPTIPSAGKMVLIVLMFAGRVGPLTVATALAVRSRDQRFRLTEERPLIG